MQQRLIIAIDGPSGSGKSSVSRAIAAHYGLQYLDTGAMYRALTWWSLQGNVSVAGCPLDISTSPSDGTVRVGEVDVTEAIRGAEVTNAVSAVAARPEVREVAVAMQRRIISAAERGIVVEGRDITTVVAPDADVRIFLTADLAAREARRAAEFQDPSLADAMRRTISTRDAADSSRAHSPLQQVAGVTMVDATHLTLDEVIAEVRELIEQSIDRTAP